MSLVQISASLAWRVAGAVLLVAACTGNAPTAAPSSTPAAASFVASPGPGSPASSGSPTSQPSQAPPAGGALFDALAFASATDSLVTFDDWAQIKASLGASDVTSASPEEDRRRVLIDGFVAPRSSPGPSSAPTRPPEFVTGGYGMANALRHAAAWGFDVLDYDWDAVISGEGAPLMLIRLRDDLDLAPIVARFDQRGFATETVGGATLRTHAMEPGADWMLEPAITNVALIGDGRTWLLSSSADRVRSALDRLPGAVPEALGKVAAALEAPSAAVLVTGGPGWCEDIAALVARAEPAVADTVNGLLDDAGPLHPWAAMGIGYSRELDPIGRIVFDYADDATAQSDSAGRRMLAEQGVSLAVGAPLSDYAFGVEDVTVDGSVIALDVAPVDDSPRRLLQALVTRDVMYAACAAD